MMLSRVYAENLAGLMRRAATSLRAKMEALRSSVRRWRKASRSTGSMRGSLTCDEVLQIIENNKKQQMISKELRSRS